MTDPTGLEERLRAALGRTAHLGTGDATGGSGLDATRAQVLMGIRQRRLRRLQMTGAAAVVMLGLAVSLPQVLGGAAPSTPTPAPSQASGSPTSNAHAALAAPTHRSEPAAPGPALPPAASSATAICHLDGKTVSRCGVLATGAAAPTFSATAASLGNGSSSGAVGSARSAQVLGRPLVVHAGTDVVIDLPRVDDRWRWDAPAAAPSSASHGKGASILVHPMRSRGTAQEFLVATKVPVTVVLVARDDVRTGLRSSSTVNGPIAVWALELEVEGT